MITVTNRKLAIGFPCSWSHVPFPFFQSFIQMERPPFVPIIACNGPIDGLRNKIVQDAMRVSATHNYDGYGSDIPSRHNPETARSWTSDCGVFGTQTLPTFRPPDLPWRDKHLSISIRMGGWRVNRSRCDWNRLSNV